MCDLFSWIKDKDGKVWFNRDEDIEIAGMNFEDGIGHSAIEKIWNITGNHIEGVLKVPREIADAVNHGKCDKMIRSARWTGLRYTKAGNINVPWWPKSVISSAKKITYFDNHAEPLPEWKLFDTRDAAGAAAGAAALLARCELAFFEDKTNEHLIHSLKRWDVYQRGYGIVCDVNGVLYVYKKL